MIEFPPEFLGMASALWTIYEPAVWIWMAIMFSIIVVLAIGIIIWNVIRRIT